jgi:surface antigen
MRIFIVLLLSMFILAGCQTTKAQNAAMLGTLAGATVGALTFKNKNSGAAIGGGTGLLVGYLIGNEMEKMDGYDHQQITNTLEHAPSGQAKQWVNPDTHRRYEARPKPARKERNGRIVRDVTLRAQMADGSYQTIYAKAYRQRDGSWQLVQ